MILMIAVSVLQLKPKNRSGCPHFQRQKAKTGNKQIQHIQQVEQQVSTYQLRKYSL